MKHKHYIGETVICIDDSNQDCDTVILEGECVVKGRQYVIRGVSRDGGLLLSGVIGGYHFNGIECGFLLKRFKSVDVSKKSKRWSKDLVQQIEKEINDEAWILKE